MLAAALAIAMALAVTALGRRFHSADAILGVMARSALAFSLVAVAVQGGRAGG